MFCADEFIFQTMFSGVGVCLRWCEPALCGIYCLVFYVCFSLLLRSILCCCYIVYQVSIVLERKGGSLLLLPNKEFRKLLCTFAALPLELKTYVSQDAATSFGVTQWRS